MNNQSADLLSNHEIICGHIIKLFYGYILLIIMFIQSNKNFFALTLLDIYAH